MGIILGFFLEKKREIMLIYFDLVNKHIYMMNNLVSP